MPGTSSDTGFSAGQACVHQQLCGHVWLAKLGLWVSSALGSTIQAACLVSPCGEVLCADVHVVMHTSVGNPNSHVEGTLK